MRPPRLFPFMMALLLVLGAVGSARGQEVFTVQPESRFWISGRSNVGRFTCRAAVVSGEGTATAARMATGSLRIPVDAFDCGHAGMNGDLRGALRSREHPEVRFRLVWAGRSAALPDSVGWLPVVAEGALSMAGVDRPVRVEARARRLDDGTFRLRGRVALRLTDFGIRPPVALLGLVRAADAFVAHFDLVASCHTLLASDADASCFQ